MRIDRGPLINQLDSPPHRPKPLRGRHRALVAGPVPPPYAGQHLMVEFALRRLAGDDRFVADHLSWQFAPSFESQHDASLAKVVELMRVVGRLVRLAARGGRYDVAVFPVGSPSLSSTARDLAVLPFVLLASRRTVLHFHGGGHEASWSAHPAWWTRLAARLYRRAAGAIVMTEFNRVDPAWLGIRDVAVLPHRLPDAFDPSLRARPPVAWEVLYVGHLGPQRSTPGLLEAFAAVRATIPEARLRLVGRGTLGYTEDDLGAAIDRLGLADAVEVTPEATGEAKWSCFATASCFIFPSVYECESFGLVLAEALMWGLPVVLTDWRGNTDVVPEGCDRVVVAVGDDLVADLAGAMLAAHERWGTGAFCEANRSTYLERYAGLEDWPLGDVLLP